MKQMLIAILLLTTAHSFEVPKLCKSYEGREQMFCIAINIQDSNIKVLKAQNKLLKDQNAVMQELLFIKRGTHGHEK